MKCTTLKFIGTHQDKVFDTKPLVDSHDVTIGLVVINRCELCGRISHTRIYTDNNYR